MMKIKRRITKSYFDIARDHYLPLVKKLSLLIGVDEPQKEELRSRADEELLKCMICYDGSGSLITFFYCRLSGVFRHLRDTERRAKRIQSISTNSMINIVGHYCDMDFPIMVEECLECLNDEERDIIKELFFNGKSMREVSNDRGVVASTICRIKAKAIGKMKKKCEVGQE